MGCQLTELVRNHYHGKLLDILAQLPADISASRRAEAGGEENFRRLSPPALSTFLQK